MNHDTAGIAPHDRFQANEPGVVADVIHDETLIMNLDSGDYYSLNPAAGVLWNLVVAGVRRGEIRATVARRHGAEPDQAEVDSFIARLLDHRLIVSREGDDMGQARDLPLTAWTAPEIVVYRDMRDLLAMDPPLPRKKPA